MGITDDSVMIAGNYTMTKLTVIHITVHTWVTLLVSQLKLLGVLTIIWNCTIIASWVNISYPECLIAHLCASQTRWIITLWIGFSTDKYMWFSDNAMTCTYGNME